MNRNKKKVIVVGGGTAALTISNRLSSKFDVRLMERSAIKNLPLFYRIPLFIGYLFKKNNNFVSTYEIDGPYNRKLPFFESRVFGGASFINGTVHAVGSRWLWRKILNKYNFTWAELQSSYNYIFGNLIKLRKKKADNLDMIFANTLEKMGIPKCSIEFAENTGVGPIINTAGKIFRSSVRDLGNPININLDSNVKHILIDEKKIVGVECNGISYYADYVILSSGVLGSNALIKNGFKDIKTQDVVFPNLPDMGWISDHTNLRINVKVKSAVESLNQLSTQRIRKIALFIKHCLGFSTLLAGTGATSAAHLDLDGDGHVDVRIQLLRFYESGRAGSTGKFFDSNVPGFSISITVINPKSTGSIKGAGTQTQPDPRYLSNPSDFEPLKKALRFIIGMLQSEDFSKIIDEIIDVDEIINDPENFIKKNIYSGYHLIGGLSEFVDEDFKVKDFENLYICDASVISSHPSSNIHAPVVLLSDVFAKRFAAELLP